MPDMTYTTGEIAALCAVSVRTVQYYDKRGILSPTALSEGGRRIYSEDDLKRLRIICYLRECDLPIDTIGLLMKEQQPEGVLSLILTEQEKALQEEIEDKQSRLDRIAETKKALSLMETVDLYSLIDAARVTKNKKKLARLRAALVVMALPCNVIEIATLAIWIATGAWWPFAIGIPASLLIGIVVVQFYLARVDYLCPTCHSVFRPSLKETLFAPHTPATRTLTCPKCAKKRSCIELYKENESC